ncbi:hypothetical protein GCM10027047_30810 [Rhodococcus aerolatus]
MGAHDGRPGEPRRAVPTGNRSRGAGSPADDQPTVALPRHGAPGPAADDAPTEAVPLLPVTPASIGPSPLPPLPPAPWERVRRAGWRGGADGAGPDGPRKVTVTRVAAQRSRDLTRSGLRTFHRAAAADGADESGLTSLTYAVMAGYASDAAIAVSLANTLFFAAATAESKANVALYLLITVAPFAVIAPLVGPALDRVQRGRRLALSGSFVLRAVLAVVMAVNFDNWLLYPAALGVLVLSKSFGVLKSSVMPRVLPPGISLVTSNSRLTVFGLVGGGVVGAVASGVAAVTGSAGSLVFTAAVMLVGAWLCLRIPSWVEVTEGEVPTTLIHHQDPGPNGTARLPRLDPTAPAAERPRGRRAPREPIGRRVLMALWGNTTTRVLTGFLTLFAAFVVKAHTEQEPGVQLAMLAVIGAAAGTGSFVGNAAGARLPMGRPDAVVLWCTSVALASVVLAAAVPGLATAAVVGLVAGSTSSLAKVSLDATIQRDVAEESRASAFGRSETVLQLGWVLGGALGVLLPAEWWIGFTVISVVLGLGLLQTELTRRGSTMVPNLGGRRPRRSARAARVR